MTPLSRACIEYIDAQVAFLERLNLRDKLMKESVAFRIERFMRRRDEVRNQNELEDEDE